jgi:hypothetical protein
LGDEGLNTGIEGTPHISGDAMLSTLARSPDVTMTRLHARHEAIAAAAPFLTPVEDRWSDLPLLRLHRDRPWLLVPAQRDPIRARNGGPVIPAAQLDVLRGISARGARFDAVAIAHELDPNGPASRLVPQLRGGPRTCSDDVARLLVGPVPDQPDTARLARIMDRAVAGLGRAATLGGKALAGTVAGAAATALAITDPLDPIVVGVLGEYGAPADGEPALYYALTAWRW